MFRWIAVLAAVALAVSAAYGQSSPQTQFPSGFDARIAMLENPLAGLNAIREAAVALYGKLDTGQTGKADTLLPMSLCL